MNFNGEDGQFLMLRQHFGMRCLLVEFLLYDMIEVMDDTIFHKILRQEIPADVVYEDDDVLVFKDIQPQMPTHLLLIPKTFVASVADCTDHLASPPRDAPAKGAAASWR